MRAMWARARRDIRGAPRRLTRAATAHRRLSRSRPARSQVRAVQESGVNNGSKAGLGLATLVAFSPRRVWRNLPYIESLWEFSLNSRLSCRRATSSVGPDAAKKEALSKSGTQTQLTVSPPSTTSSVPVTYFASSEARNRASYATSQASPHSSHRPLLVTPADYLFCAYCGAMTR